jgi:GT2 family glycosyltransferase
MTVTLYEDLLGRNNVYTPSTHEFEAVAGLGWHEPTPSELSLPDARTISVILPAHDVDYCLAVVLDALKTQHHRQHFEVIVIDDGSTDQTTRIAATHPVVSRAVRLPEPMGAATARNLGTFLARGQTLLYLDADMVLPPHVISDVAARATDRLVLVGFRHNVPFAMHRGGHGFGAGKPQLHADHRVVWRPPVGVPLLYTGITLSEPLDGRPLDHTRDFLDLGQGRRYYDWDLPRMMVTALAAVPHAAVLEIGGFDSEFGRIGWGMEDTYLGACLIAAGLLIVPLRQAVGFHLDPPDVDEQWQRKLAGWPATLARYWELMDQPAPAGRACSFAAAMTDLLSSCEVLR